MYELTVKAHFDAAHSLRGYGGQCEALHGHRYEVEIKLRCPELDAIGLGYDFRLLKSQLGGILEGFDHHFLNEVPPFDKVNPSAENIARTIYERLVPLIDAPANLASVTAWESPDSGATYPVD